MEQDNQDYIHRAFSKYNQQKLRFLPKEHFSPSVDTSGEVDSDTTFFSSPKVCEFQKTICPKNIPKYSMKCIFNKNACRIRKYFKRFNGLDLNKLGVGS